MLAYASRTGTRRNLAALRGAGWRLFVSARGVLRTEGFPYALDNGAWTAWRRGEPFDMAAFGRALDLLGVGADFVVLPDIVEGGIASLDLSLSWLPRVAAYGARMLLPVQDGMEPADVRPHLGPRVGIFIGGSTLWKVRTARVWGPLAREREAWCHMGRVNTARRVMCAALAGCDSFDGSSVSRFAVNLPMLDRARRQEVLRWW